MPANEILERVRKGTLDGMRGKAHALPESTFWHILARKRKERKLATDPVIPGGEVAAAGAILRRILELSNRELKRTESALESAKTQRERAEALANLERLAKTIGDVQWRLRKGEAQTSKTEPRTARERATAAHDGAPKGRSTTAKLLAEQRRILSAPASPIPHPTTQGTKRSADEAAKT